MGAHWRRIMHPRDRFAIFMGKLLSSGRGGEVGDSRFYADTPYRYYLPRSKQVLWVRPQYITQNW